MGLLEQWKEAKTAFANTTDAKKPSKTILGIRQGTGIEDACKKVDNAKTVGDMTDAIGLLTSKSKAYLELLKKAFADPKEVKTSDKQVYMSALRRLEQALTDITSEAEAMLKTLELQGGGKKSKVNSEELQKQTNDEAMEKVRFNLQILQGAITDGESLRRGADDSKRRVLEIGQKIDKHFDDAKKHAKEKNPREYEMACSMIERWAGEADKIAVEARRIHESTVQNGGGNIMKARGATGRPRGLSPQEGDKFSKTAAQLFRRGAEIALAAGGVVSEIEASAEQFKVTYAQSLNLMGGNTDPTPVTRDLEVVNTQVGPAARDELKKLVGQLDKARKAVPSMLSAPDQKSISALLGFHENNLQNALPALKSAAQRAQSLVTRVGTYRQLAASNPQLKKLMQEVLVGLSEYKTVADNGVRLGNEVAEELKPVRTRLEQLENAVN